MNWKNYESLTAGIGGIFISFLFYAIPPDTACTVRLPLALLIPLAALIWYIAILKKEYLLRLEALSRQYVKELDNLRNVTPKIKVISCNDSGLCLSSNIGNIISVGSLLTIFYRENNFERFYGIVKLTNIQENNILQAEFIKKENLTHPPHIIDLVVKINLTESVLMNLR